MDSVKPLDKRRGWAAAQVGEHNRERFEDLISAGWDLVIVDEAHRLGGSTDQVARFKLGQGLSEAALYFLLLSATPHQGKTDAFMSLMSLIDKDEFPSACRGEHGAGRDISSVTRERIQPYVICTGKRRAIYADGKPLFIPWRRFSRGDYRPSGSNREEERMTRRTDQIGFSQRVRLEWLEQTANLILAGNDKAAVNEGMEGESQTGVTTSCSSLGRKASRLKAPTRASMITMTFLPAVAMKLRMR